MGQQHWEEFWHVNKNVWKKCKILRQKFLEIFDCQYDK